MSDKKSILVLGSGVVGQATGMGMLEKGHKVTFVDINIDTIRRLSHAGYDARLPEEVEETTKIDFIMVCVGTPPRRQSGAVNLDYIKEGMATVSQFLENSKNWPVVVIRSTVPPTTTRDVLVPLMERWSDKEAGHDFGVCFNPEFLRAKSAAEDFRHPWATVIGELDKKSGDKLEDLYHSFGGKLFRVSIPEAELIKYVNNLRNALVISFSNEIWLLGQELGVDANEALKIATHTAESAWNPKYGSIGGQPYGGTCLPKDTKGLLRLAEELGINMPLLSSVIKVNEALEDLANEGVVPHAQIIGHKWEPSPSLANQSLESE